MKVKMGTWQVRQTGPGSFSQELVAGTEIREVTDEQGQRLIEAGKAFPVEAKKKVTKKKATKKKPAEETETPPDAD